MKRRDVKFNEGNLENVTKCNIIFTALYYFLACYWSGCRPIVNSKPKFLNPLKSMNLCHWSIILGGGIKTSTEVRNHTQGTSFSVRLQLAEGEYSTSGRLPYSPAGSLYCTVGGELMALAVLPLTTVMTLKRYLQRASVHHYSKKSSPVKYAEGICFIFHSM